MRHAGQREFDQQHGQRAGQHERWPQHSQHASQAGHAQIQRTSEQARAKIAAGKMQDEGKGTEPVEDNQHAGGTANPRLSLARAEPAPQGRPQHTGYAEHGQSSAGSPSGKHALADVEQEQPSGVSQRRPGSYCHRRASSTRVAANRAK